MSKFLRRTSAVRTCVSRGVRHRAPTAHPYSQSPAHLVTFMRHGQSTWNACDLFTGWYDVPLSKRGVREATEAAAVFEKEAILFDVIFCSELQRAKETAEIVLKTGEHCADLVSDYRLNERHYGALTGYNKEDLVEQYGIKQVQSWRYGFTTIPPPMTRDHPCFDDINCTFPEIEVPKGESLKMTLRRAADFWRSTIAPEIKAGKQVLIVTHNNTLRALIKYLENLSYSETVRTKFRTGWPFTYSLDMYMQPVRNKKLVYLGRVRKSR